MFPEVAEHIPDAAMCLPWRLYHFDVIAIGKYLAAAPPRASSQCRIDVPRRRDREALHSASEGRLVLSLDKHVDVVPLQADVDDPEPLAQRGGDRRLAHRLVEPATP